LGQPSTGLCPELAKRISKAHREELHRLPPRPPASSESIANGSMDQWITIQQA
jgi:hypothetical protein